MSRCFANLSPVGCVLIVKSRYCNIWSVSLPFGLFRRSDFFLISSEMPSSAFIMYNDFISFYFIYDYILDNQRVLYAFLALKELLGVG